MGNAVDSGYSVPTLEVAPASPSRRMGVVGMGGLLAALLAIALAGWFAFNHLIDRDWADSDLMLALPVLWLVGLIWKGVRHG